jgi:hypothetical protein
MTSLRLRHCPPQAETRPLLPASCPRGPNPPLAQPPQSYMLAPAAVYTVVCAIWSASVILGLRQTRSIWRIRRSSAVPVRVSQSRGAGLPGEHGSALQVGDTSQS